jgi:hypothetical protein
MNTTDKPFRFRPGVPSGRAGDHKAGVARAIADAVGDELIDTWHYPSNGKRQDEAAMIYTAAGNL